MPWFWPQQHHSLDSWKESANRMHGRWDRGQVGCKGNLQQGGTAQKQMYLCKFIPLTIVACISTYNNDPIAVFFMFVYIHTISVYIKYMSWSLRMTMGKSVAIWRLWEDVCISVTVVGSINTSGGYVFFCLRWCGQRAVRWEILCRVYYYKEDGQRKR